MKPKSANGGTDAKIASVPSAAENRKKINFRLEGGTSGSAVVLHCQGRVVSRSEARSLSLIVAEVLPSAGRMIVDLSEIDAADSGGLGELALTQMWAEAAGYTLKFASPKKSLLDLVEVTNLTSVFDIHNSVPEAMAAMAMIEEKIPSA